MLKPFRIVWELIEFGLQALFLYGLAIILCIGLITYVIVDNKEKLARQPKNEVPILVEVKKTLKNTKKPVKNTKKTLRSSRLKRLEDQLKSNILKRKSAKKNNGLYDLIDALELQADLMEL